MTPRTVHPRSNVECINLLLTLGFKKKKGIGRSKHPEKYYHPTRKNMVENDKPFILITHNYFDELGIKLMKKLQNWGFTKNEIESALSGIKPSDEKSLAEIDVEPEEA